MRNIGFVIVAAATLAGCESGPSRQQVLASLVGQQESTALQVLGAPTHVIDANGHRFLAYEDQGVSYGAVAPYGPYGYGYGYFPGTFPFVRSCTTTLDIAGGRVASWTLRGNACG